MNIKGWLSKDQENDLELAITAPRIARLPLPDLTQPEAPQPKPMSQERELISRALAVASEQEKERKDLMVKLTEATLRLESASRQIRDQSSTIATLQNNELNYQAQIEVFRQENAELKAFFQQHRSAMEWILRRFDEYSIPSRKRNGNDQPQAQTKAQGEVKANEAKAEGPNSAEGGRPAGIA